ncbi:hypothetical protein [Methanosphaerula subterraneus]|uniref:hypothetical protein n=1 Tax=Methanosphaerula subterraneus TaxID=3350244 RepID=UPI003F8271FE
MGLAVKYLKPGVGHDFLSVSAVALMNGGLALLARSIFSGEQMNAIGTVTLTLLNSSRVQNPTDAGAGRTCALTLVLC